MPTYEYRCPECGHSHEEFRSIDKRKVNLPTCSNCGATMNLGISAPALLGFDDVGRSLERNDNDSSSKKETKASEKKTESKSSTSEKTKTKAQSSD